MIPRVHLPKPETYTLVYTSLSKLILMAIKYIIYQVICISTVFQIFLQFHKTGGRDDPLISKHNSDEHQVNMVLGRKFEPLIAYKCYIIIYSRYTPLATGGIIAMSVCCGRKPGIHDRHPPTELNVLKYCKPP